MGAIFQKRQFTKYIAGFYRYQDSGGITSGTDSDFHGALAQNVDGLRSLSLVKNHLIGLEGPNFKLGYIAHHKFAHI